MSVRPGSSILAALAAIVATPALAADLPSLVQNPPTPPSTRLFLHLGPAGAFPDTSAKISTPFGRVPGASAKIAPRATATAEVGYFFAPNWAVALSGGVPPTLALKGTGTVAPLGTLGSGIYGPIALTGQYHLTAFGRFQPYAGLGPTYLIAFANEDGVVANFKLRSAWGAVGQVGADFMITEQVGVFLDLKKAYLRTTASGTLGFLPVSARLKLDPLVISGGLTLRL